MQPNQSVVLFGVPYRHKWAGECALDLDDTGNLLVALGDITRLSDLIVVKGWLNARTICDLDNLSARRHGKVQVPASIVFNCEHLNQAYRQLVRIGWLIDPQFGTQHPKTRIRTCVS